MTNILSKHIKKFAIIASMLMLTMIAVPMVAAEDECKYCDEIQSSTTDITPYDLDGAEIEIMGELPFIVVEIEKKYAHIPYILSDYKEIMVDSTSIIVEVDGTYLLIPTKYGIEQTCISEFDVKLVNGELVLVHEVNPVFEIGGITVIVSGGTIIAMSIGAGAVAGMAVYVGTAILRGRRPTPGGIAEAAGEGAASAILTIMAKFGGTKVLNWIINNLI